MQLALAHALYMQPHFLCEAECACALHAVYLHVTNLVALHVTCKNNGHLQAMVYDSCKVSSC